MEVRALNKNDSKVIAVFLYEDVIYRHRVFKRLVVNGGPENKALVKELARKYGIYRLIVLSYHP